MTFFLPLKKTAKRRDILPHLLTKTHHTVNGTWRKYQKGNHEKNAPGNTENIRKSLAVIHVLKWATRAWKRSVMSLQTGLCMFWAIIPSPHPSRSSQRAVKTIIISRQLRGSNARRHTGRGTRHNWGYLVPNKRLLLPRSCWDFVA